MPPAFEERDAESDDGPVGEGFPPPSSPSVFSSGADSECIYCSLSGKKTAELLYMSPEWDYYYCYRCREWFKRSFKHRALFLPVKSRAEVRYLTWVYTSRLRYLYEMKQISQGMDGVRRYVEKHLLRP